MSRRHFFNDSNLNAIPEALPLLQSLRQSEPDILFLSFSVSFSAVPDCCVQLDDSRPTAVERLY